MGPLRFWREGYINTAVVKAPNRVYRQGGRGLRAWRQGTGNVWPGSGTGMRAGWKAGGVDKRALWRTKNKSQRRDLVERGATH